MAKRCSRTRMSAWDKAFSWVLAVGGLNLGLTAVGFNAVDKIATALTFPTLATIVYGLVGFSAVWLIVRSFMKFR